MQPSRFDITIEDDSPVLVLRLRGELDLATVALVQETVDRHAVGRPGLIVDLGALEFLDAAGLRLMVELRRRHGRQLAFGQPRAPVGRVLDITGLRGAFYWVARPHAAHHLSAHDRGRRDAATSPASIRLRTRTQLSSGPHQNGPERRGQTGELRNTTWKSSSDGRARRRSAVRPSRTCV